MRVVKPRLRCRTYDLGRVVGVGGSESILFGEETTAYCWLARGCVVKISLGLGLRYQLLRVLLSDVLPTVWDKKFVPTVK